MNKTQELEALELQRRMYNDWIVELEVGIANSNDVEQKYSMLSRLELHYYSMYTVADDIRKLERELLKPKSFWKKLFRK